MEKPVAFYGYHCMGNAGDDAMLIAITEKLGRPALLSCRFPELSPPEVKARKVPLKGFFLAALSCRALILAGGSLLHRVPLKFMVWLRTLKLKGVKLAGLSVSLGPFPSRKDRKRVLKLTRAFDIVGLRDDFSYEEARMAGAKAVRSFDASVLLEFKPSTKTGGVGLVPHRNFLRESLRALQGTLEFGAKKVVILALHRPRPQLGDPGDFKVAETLVQAARELGAEAQMVLYNGNPRELLSRFSALDAVVSLRLHGGLFAYATGVPLVQLNYHIKCWAFARTIRLKTIAEMETRTSELAAKLEEALRKTPWSLPREEAVERALLQFRALEEVLWG